MNRPHPPSLLALLPLLPLLALAAGPAHALQLRQGEVEGQRKDDVTRYLGIPLRRRSGRRAPLAGAAAGAVLVR